MIENDLDKYPVFGMAPWRQHDPRYFINKRAQIVVWTHLGELRHADVETKNGWSITFHGLFPSIHEGDDWNTDWRWTYAPSSTETQKQ